MPLLGVPLAADDMFAQEVAKLWAAREEVVERQGINASERRLMNETFCPPDTGRNHFINESEAELRALQDALRERRQAERLLAEGLRLEELSSPLRSRDGRVALPRNYAESIARSPPTPARDPGMASPQPSGARQQDETASQAATVKSEGSKKGEQGKGAPGKEKEKEKEGAGGEEKSGEEGKDEGADKKKAKKPAPKPAWVDTYVGPATIPELDEPDGDRYGSPKRKPGAKKRELECAKSPDDRNKYLIDMYVRGKEMVTKRDKTVDKKRQELFGESGATFQPGITKFAKGIRESAGKTDKELGKYYFEMGQSHIKRRERTVIMKAKELKADSDQTDKPAIGTFAKNLRPDFKTDKEIGKYMYETGTGMIERKWKQMERKQKELDNDHELTFTPAVSEKNKIMGANAYPAKVVGSSYKKAKRYGGGTGVATKHAPMYDRGMEFELAKENHLHMKTKEQIQEKSVGITFEPKLNDRSRKIMAKKAARDRRGSCPAGTRDFSMRDLRDEYAFDVTSPAFVSPPAAGSPEAARARLSPPRPGAAGDDVFDDLLLPPNLEQLLGEIRLKQEMRHLGVR